MLSFAKVFLVEGSFDLAMFSSSLLFGPMVFLLVIKGYGLIEEFWLKGPLLLLTKLLLGLFVAPYELLFTKPSMPVVLLG